MAFRISSRRRLKAEKGKRIDGLIRPFLSLARRSAVYPSLRAIRLRWGRSRDFLFVRFVFVSIRGDCVVAHRHPRPRIAAAVIYRFATRLEARDNKARRLRGCRGPPRARCRLPRRTCVCVCAPGGWLSGVGRPKYLGRFFTVRNVAELLGILDSGRKDCSSIQE